MNTMKQKKCHPYLEEKQWIKNNTDINQMLKLVSKQF